MPKFNPYPILNPEQYRKPSYDELVNRPIQQGLQGMVDIAKTRREEDMANYIQDKQDAYKRAQIGAEGGEYALQQLDNALLNIQPPSRKLSFFGQKREPAPLNLPSNRNRIPPPPNPYSPGSDDVDLGEAYRLYGPKVAKAIAQSQQDRVDRNRQAEKDRLEAEYRQSQIEKNQADIENKERARAEEARKAERSIQRGVDRAKRVIAKVDEAIPQVDWNAAGFVGNLMKNVGGSDAADLESTLDTIAGIVGFNELQEMREASKTGGALGQVAVRELEMLQATISSLKQKQSPKQLRENLNQMKTHFTNWLSVVNDPRFASEKSGGGAGAGVSQGQIVPAEARFDQLMQSGLSEDEAYQRMAEEGY